jgi:glycosyltransferase involved in cell wall biosynthesis
VTTSIDPPRRRHLLGVPVGDAAGSFGPRPTRIVHVTESLGGGTARAMFEFVLSTPSAEHHLIACKREGSEIDVELSELFASSVICRSRWLIPQQLRRKLRELSPDIVHLHSSWAGLLGRMTATPRRVPKPRVLYSPHCFFFERANLSRTVRRLAYRVERVLSARTDLSVCVSPHELNSALGLRMRAVYVPNTSRRMTALPQGSDQVKPPRPRIITIGRVCEQKDPEFFVRVKQECARLGIRADWIWIGEGEQALVERLEGEGIEVTGWLHSPGQLLSSAGVYLHTAAWEASPMSILEAAELGIPLVVRSIPSLASLGLDPSMLDPASLAQEVKCILATGTMTRPDLQAAYRRAHQPDRQRAALAKAYDLR